MTHVNPKSLQRFQSDAPRLGIKVEKWQEANEKENCRQLCGKENDNSAFVSAE